MLLATYTLFIRDCLGMLGMDCYTPRLKQYPRLVRFPRLMLFKSHPVLFDFSVLF